MNKILKLVLTFVLSIALVGCGSSGDSGKDALELIKENGVLKIGTSPDYPPYQFYADVDGKNQIVGFEIELAKAIAEEIGVELEIIPSDFDGVKLNVQTKEVAMGISGFSRTPSREETFNFSNSYLQTNPEGYQGIMVRSEDVNKYQSIEDIKKANLKIAAQTGSIQYELALQLTSAENVIQLQTTDACAMQLSVGDVDAVVATDNIGRAFANTFTNIEMLGEEKFNLDPEDKFGKNGIIFPKDSSYDSLIEVVNKVIKESEDSGKLEEWRIKAEELKEAMAE